jgi:hypothetical protein
MAGGEPDMACEAPEPTEGAADTAEMMERWLSPSGTADQPVEGYPEPGDMAEAPGEMIDARFDTDKFMAAAPPPEGIIDPLFHPADAPPEGIIDPLFHPADAPPEGIIDPLFHPADAAPEGIIDPSFHPADAAPEGIVDPQFQPGTEDTSHAKPL